MELAFCGMNEQALSLLQCPPRVPWELIQEGAQLDYNWGVQDPPNADFGAPEDLICVCCQLDLSLPNP